MAEERKDEKKEKKGFLRERFGENITEWILGLILMGREYGGRGGSGNGKEGTSLIDEINERLPSFSARERQIWNSLWQSLSSTEQDQIEDFLSKASMNSWDKLHFEHQAMLNLKHEQEKDKKLLVVNSSIRKTLVEIASHTGNYEYQERKALQNKLLLKLEGVRWVAQNKSNFGLYLVLLVAILALGLLALMRWGTN